ncbi:MAG: 3-dehydroquinate dehydratase-2 [Candidatus Deianiraeaceae bacterium]|jgi:3-dehydroquinate dehydratase-2
MAICILNGPNLNMLGSRESAIYGSKTLEQAIMPCQKLCEENNIPFAHFQSNHEGEIIDFLHKEGREFQFIIANLGAYTHTSIAIRDAFLSLNLNVGLGGVGHEGSLNARNVTQEDTRIIELHISNVFAREEFRHKSYISDIALSVISGFGIEGYHLATQFAIKLGRRNNGQAL